MMQILTWTLLLLLSFAHLGHSQTPKAVPAGEAAPFEWLPESVVDGYFLGQHGDELSVPTDTEPKRVWQFGRANDEAGRGGSLIFNDAGARPEIYVPFNGRAWGSFRYRPEHGDFWPVSFWYPDRDASLAGLQLVRLTAAGPPVIATHYQDGSVELFDVLTKTQIGGFDKNLTRVRSLVVADLDGDGISELVMNHVDPPGNRAISAFDASGNLEWRVERLQGQYHDVGQVDDDPALEIVTGAGELIQYGTQEVEKLWTVDSDVTSVRVLDIDGDPAEEVLYSVQNGGIFAFDVETRSEIWHDPEEWDVTTVTEFDGSPGLELLKSRFSLTQVLDLATGAVEVEQIEAGSGTGLLVGDVDRDDELEYVMTRGYFEVLDVKTLEVEWRSRELNGDFHGPLVGDFDGDGIQELASVSSDNPKLLLFDGRTLELRSISRGPDIQKAFAALVVDLDSDGRDEILIPGRDHSGAFAGAYGLGVDSDEFLLEWRNESGPDAGFYDLAVGDLTGDGVPEVIGAAGAEAHRLIAYDLATRQPIFESHEIAEPNRGLRDVVVEDVDRDGQPEVLVVVHNDRVAIFDSSLSTVEYEIVESLASLKVLPVPGQSPLILTGSLAGSGTVYRYSGGSYEVAYSRTFPDDVQGFVVGPLYSLWVAVRGRTHAYSQLWGEPEWVGPSSDAFPNIPYHVGFGHRRGNLAFALGGEYLTVYLWD